ncbi:2-polyprenyl-6-methoxyphenol hydroxylase [Streptomyces sp. 1222.5]|uniref:FAD-dependent oxidoreductase n=1 Tax=unclassified Streptomyces TaxID=2593676 RepID=UPI000895E38F|nr:MULTISPECIES: FAD-dependent oxidoreductase [unclassified Streptomyces]PKW00341.1 2-polyprenyl-6-methoxyphenol hydroxylase-like FAD-dependent oxidoreductase [Streptomyces sp. 5112.2]SED85965.1 2-polyprenyl-6-methoxyphenol hydroxylase [Streptomyces sp. 1222.5]SEE68352.1 2-polyprenyl-6-methoxyphenol hydroxylase [Streptomyces sp. 2231.1]
MTNRVGERAVVLGGSMAGLLAARVLADSYDEVLVVERDTITGTTTARKGVGQGRHVHGLLARGQQILDELFPGFTDEAVEAGVPTGDLGELRWFFNGRRLSPGTTGLICVSATRPVLESRVRERVAALPGVVLLERHDIAGLVADDTRDTVTGVRVQSQEAGAQERTIEADLVVDATGRGSRTPLWLEDFGYERPDEERIRIDLSYTTRKFRLRDDAVLDGDLSINPVSSPSHRRGAFLSRIEGGLVVVSLTGVLGDSAPADLPGFLEWTRTLPVSDIHDVIHDAEPVDDGAVFRYPASQRRRYERLSRFPNRFLVLGDAACSFNPVYGQGMTVAALETLVLREHLSRGEVDPKAFLADIAQVIEVPWQFSAGADLGYPEVEGERTPEWEASGAFMAALHAAAVVDGEVTATFMRVAGLVATPDALMSPDMLRRVEEGAAKAAAPLAA